MHEARHPPLRSDKPAAPFPGCHAVLLAGATFMLMPFLWMVLTAIRAPDEILLGGLKTRSRAAFMLSRTFGRAAAGAADALHAQWRGSSAPGSDHPAAGRHTCSLRIGETALSGKDVAVCSRDWRALHPDPGPCPADLSHPRRAGPAGQLLRDDGAVFSLGLAIFLFRQTFLGFPDEILQAARVDGLGEFEILWRIVVPSAMPAIAAFSIFSIVAHWNDLYWPMIVIQRMDYAPPPLGMLFFANSETGASYGVLMAGATIVTAPLVLIFCWPAAASCKASR